MKPWHIWLLLVAATLTSWFVTEGETSASVGSTAVILIAAFKINLVIAHFMELKWQPIPYRIVLSGWIFLVSAIIIGGIWAA
jgi:Prokaryotic Cytochrome C oxidase subunit IV